MSGRNGDIVTDNKRFKNIDATYKVAAASDTFSPEQTARKIKHWLQGEAGYFVLSDTYDPNYFRYACYYGKIDIENKLRLLGKATLKFNCKPFRYRIDGQREIRMTETGRIYNPEDWESAPYIKIVGSGDITLSINDASFAFRGIDDISKWTAKCKWPIKAQNFKTTKRHSQRRRPLRRGKTIFPLRERSTRLLSSRGGAAYDTDFIQSKRNRLHT